MTIEHLPECARRPSIGLDVSRLGLIRLSLDLYIASRLMYVKKRLEWSMTDIVCRS